ncbi:hypothetical protein [Sphingomonas faeni]|uniref:hypothetical protein n=1 Tax=Sphingomonas faeni TaxID=185950 RepID=UPI00334AB05D
MRDQPRRGTVSWLIEHAPTVAFFVTAAVVLYLLGYATHLTARNAADNDALLEFIGSIIGAAIGPGLAVIGSFWLDQRRQLNELKHDRQMLAGALEQLAGAIAKPPLTLLSDVSGKISARRQREQARAIVDAARDSEELMGMSKYGLRLGDTDLMRRLTTLQRNMRPCLDALQPREADFADEAAIADYLDEAIHTAAETLLTTIFEARRMLDR